MGGAHLAGILEGITQALERLFRHHQLVHDNRNIIAARDLWSYRISYAINHYSLLF